MEQSKDHDLLIELRTKIEGISQDIRDIKDGTKNTLDDHETRIRTLEGYRTTLAGGLALAQVVMGIILWYFSR